MIEIRFKVEDIEKFMQGLTTHKANQIKVFSFTDTYYIPQQSTAQWEKGLSAIRIREMNNSTKLLYSQYSINIQNEIALITNNLNSKQILSSDENAIIQLLRDLNLQKKAILRRESGKVFEIQNLLKGDKNIFEFTLEKIDHYGFTSEVEFDNNKLSIEHLNEIIRFFKNAGANPIKTTLLLDYLTVSKLSVP